VRAGAGTAASGNQSTPYQRNETHEASQIHPDAALALTQDRKGTTHFRAPTRAGENAYSSSPPRS